MDPQKVLPDRSRIFYEHQRNGQSRERVNRRANDNMRTMNLRLRKQQNRPLEDGGAPLLFLYLLQVLFQPPLYFPDSYELIFENGAIHPVSKYEQPDDPLWQMPAILHNRDNPIRVHLLY